MKRGSVREPLAPGTTTSRTPSDPKKRVDFKTAALTPPGKLIPNGCYGSLGLFFHKNLSAFYKDLSAFYKITNISRPLQRSLGLLTNYKNLSAFFKKNLSALVQKFPERQQIFSFLFFVEFSLQKSSTSVFLN